MALNVEDRRLMKALVLLLSANQNIIDLSTDDKAFISSTIDNHAMKS